MLPGRALASLLASILLAGCTRAGFGSDDLRIASLERGVDQTRLDRRLDALAGSLWRELAGSASGYGVSARKASAATSQVVTVGGMPYLAWSDEHTGTRQVYLRRWDGSAWVGLGGSDSGGGVSSTTDEARLGGLALDGNGRPALAWMVRGSFGSGILYRRWSGSAWEEVSGSATGKGVSGIGNVWWPALVFDSVGRATLAWEAYNLQPSGVIHLRQLVSNSWSELAGSASGAGLSSGAGKDYWCALAAGPGGALHALWQRDLGAVPSIIYRRYDGASWSAEQTLSAPGELAQRGAIDLAVPHDRPVVVWQAASPESTATAVRLRRLHGSVWEGLGGSDSEAGVSTSTGNGRNPAVVFDADGRIVVAWEADDSVGTNIHVRRWDRGAWVDLSRPEAGGVSASATDSTFPHLAADSSGVYLAWEESLSDGSCAIYLRHLPR